MRASHRPGTDPAAGEEVLARLALAAALFAGLPVAAAQELSIYVTVAARVAERKVLARTLEDALGRSLAARPRALPVGYSIDASLVRLDVSPRGAELQVRVEVRAVLADERGRIEATAGVLMTARGAARDRPLLMRDAVSEAAGQLVKRFTRR